MVIRCSPYHMGWYHDPYPHPHPTPAPTPPDDCVIVVDEEVVRVIIWDALILILLRIVNIILELYIYHCTVQSKSHSRGRGEVEGWGWGTRAWAPEENTVREGGGQAQKCPIYDQCVS